MVDLPRPHALLDFRQGGELHQLVATSPQVDPRHVARRGPVTGIELHHHIVQLVVPGERADPATAEERLERGGDVAHGHAEVLRAVPVEGDAQLRLVDAQVGVDVRQTLDGAGLRHECVHGLAEPREIRMLHHELHRLAEPERSRAVRERLEAGDPEELGEQHANELLDAVLAFAPILEDDADKRPVDAPGESADDREVALDTRGLADDLLDLAHVAVRVLER